MPEMLPLWFGTRLPQRARFLLSVEVTDHEY